MKKSIAGLLGLGCLLMLNGCVAELIGPELAAGEAAAVGEAAVAGAGEAAVVGSELEGAGAVEGIEGSALRARPGALEPFLERITRGGELRPTLAITRAGEVSLDGRVLASLEGEGAIVSRIQGQRYLVGRIYDGRIWEVTREGKLASAVGEIGGYVQSEGLFLRSEPNPFSSRVGILRSDTIADVLRRERGWYEIRMRSGAKGWIRAPFVGILTTLYAVAKRDDDDKKNEAPQKLFLTTGQVLHGMQTNGNEGALEVVVDTGKHIVMDRSLLASTRSLQWDWGAQAQRTALTNGVVLLASPRQTTNGATLLELPDGSPIVVDSTLLKDTSIPIAPLTSDTQASDVPQVSDLTTEGTRPDGN